MWYQIVIALHQSIARILTKVAILLPALVALLLAVIVFTLLGLLISSLLRRMLFSINFDERINENSADVSEWSPNHSPSLLLSRIAFWGCIILGCIIGISAFDAAYSSSSEILDLLLPYLAHAVGAAVILILGNIVARFLARSVLIGSVNMNLQYARLLSQGVKWLVLVLTAAMILDHLGIGGAIVELAFGILFGGIVLALALAIGLGSKEMVSRSLEGEREPLKRPEEVSASKLRHF
jgi:hypothetical protein